MPHLKVPQPARGGNKGNNRERDGELGIAPRGGTRGERFVGIPSPTNSLHPGPGVPSFGSRRGRFSPPLFSSPPVPGAQATGPERSGPRRLQGSTVSPPLHFTRLPRHPLGCHFNGDFFHAARNNNFSGLLLLFSSKWGVWSWSWSWASSGSDSSDLTRRSFFDADSKQRTSCESQQIWRKKQARTPCACIWTSRVSVLRDSWGCVRRCVSLGGG